MTQHEVIDGDADAVVIGGGITGISCALDLAGSGARVVLVEKGAALAVEASGRNFGGLRIHGRQPPEIPLARAANDIWRAVAPAASEANIRFGGNLYIATRPGQVALVDKVYREGVAADQPMSRPDGVDLARLVSLRDVSAALAVSFHPLDGHGDPSAAALHFGRQLPDAGVTVRLRTTVRRILRNGDGAVCGVATGHGTVRAPSVVLATGIWTRQLLRTVDEDMPIHRRTVTLGRTTPVAARFAPVVQHSEFTAWQRDDGRIVLGTGLGGRDTMFVDRHDLSRPRELASHAWSNRASTRLRLARTPGAGQRNAPAWTDPVPDHTPWPAPDVAELRRALTALRDAVTGTESAELEHSWTGVLDTTPDALPVLDRIPDVPGLVVLAGMSGHGMAIGPVTGRIGARLVRGEPPGFDLSAFAFGRFRERRRRSAARPG